MKMPLKLIVMSATLQISDFTGVDKDGNYKDEMKVEKNRRVLFRTMAQPKVPLVPPVIQVLFCLHFGGRY